MSLCQHDEELASCELCDYEDSRAIQCPWECHGLSEEAYPYRPRLKLRTWKPRSGERRIVRLYTSWRNMLQRVAGTTNAGCGRNYWEGLEIEWKTFEEFRVWALEWGYSKQFCSLDRIDPEKGYTRENCRWLPVIENSARRRKANEARWNGPYGEWSFGPRRARG